MAVELITDEKWGEVRRETGFATITDIDQQNGHRNAQVKLKAEQLTDPLQGWVDTVGDREVHLAALAAFTGGQRVFYRIETRRKDATSTAAIKDLAGREKTREVKEITPVDGKGVPIGAPVIPAPAPPPADPDGQVEAPVVQAQPEVEAEAARPPRPGARVAEARVYEPLNSDGSLNLGSYAVTAAQSMVSLANDLLIERWRRGDVDAPPTEGQLRGLARRLLLAADRVQAASRADHHADRMDNSHARARGAVEAALKSHPVPFGGDPAPWLEELVATASSFMAVVVSLVDREIP